jgi:predicted nucleic acid-binding protein
VKSVHCDINVILDIFLKRDPHYAPAARLFTLIEEKKLPGNLSAQSFPTMFHLLSRELKREKAMRVLEKPRIVFRLPQLMKRLSTFPLLQLSRTLRTRCSIIQRSASKQTA